ncbi:HEPN domain-containing protein [Streptomyces chartreusis]
MSKRITELRNHLLPRSFDPLGLYTDRVYERTRSFRILAHAEFESYIEDRVVEVVTHAAAAYSNSSTIRPSLLALVSHWEEGWPRPTSILSPPQRQAPDLQGRINKARIEFVNFIRTKNHGIKEKNLLFMLFTVGVLESEINRTWLQSVEDWAKLRGESAHKSGKVQTQPDPEIEYNKVKYIRSGFKDLDVLLSSK